MPSNLTLPEKYPAQYQFRVIGRAGPGLREHVRQLIAGVVGHIGEEAIEERPSSAGKYTAVHVTCTVQSEEQRRAVYERFHGDPQIVWVV